MIQAQKGTKDKLPQESITWQMMEKRLLFLKVAKT